MTSHAIYLFVLFAIMVAAATKPRIGLELSKALNMTLCPTVVKYDVNANRIPRIIKTLECKESPKKMCAAAAGVQCCLLKHADDSLVFKCAQVIDHVLVRSKDSSHTYSIPVPVGCSCITQQATYARDVD